MCWNCLLQRWWIILSVFVVLYFFAMQDKWPEIEPDLQNRTSANLKAEGLNNIQVSFNELGRTGRLTGTTSSQEFRDKAVRLAQATYGVSAVMDQIAIIEPAVSDDTKVDLPNVEGHVMLEGVVSSPAERDLLVAAAVDRFGVTKVVDNIVISKSVASQQWFGGLVSQLDVDNGLTTISVEGDSVTVTGIVKSEDLRKKVLAEIRAKVGDSYRVIDDITVDEIPVSDETSVNEAV